MIEIKKNPNGDTRTAPKGITFEQFQEANDMHIEDVKSVMWELSRMVDRAGENHDCTKKSQERMFYRDFVDTQENGTDFINGEWYKLHVKAERHHLLSNCPDDVNLIDVLEMIADCTCAGLARSGEIRDLEIDSDILNKACKNTAELIKSMVTVKRVRTYYRTSFGDVRPSQKKFYKQEYTNYPKELLTFPLDKNRQHPTQKPVALLGYLIKTYTNENETVLDNTMGSGSTGVAAVNTDRNFIGIELDENYFNIAKERIEQAKVVISHAE